MSAAAEEIASDDQSGQALAEAWSLEYLKASSVSVDPRALSLLEREDCKRLRAIPLATGSNGGLVAVCAPSEERFAAIRELTGEQTRFVLISEGTLDALLGSRMFGEPRTHRKESDAPPRQEASPEPVDVEAEEVDLDPAAGPAAAARRKRRGGGESEQPQEPETAVPEELPAPTAAASAAPVAEEPPPAPDAAVENIVGAVLSALRNRVGSSTELPPAKPSGETVPLPGSTEELLAHLDATVETWSALRTSLASVHTEFEDTKRALREAKEQLSVAHADNDQYRKRVRTLEGELAESRELVTQARARVHEAAELLESDPTQLREAADLL
jgi:MshEN domain